MSPRAPDFPHPRLCAERAECGACLRKQHLGALGPAVFASGFSLLQKHLRELEWVFEVTKCLAGPGQSIDRCGKVTLPCREQTAEAVGLGTHRRRDLAGRKPIDVANQLAHLGLQLESPRRQARLGKRVPARRWIRPVDHGLRQLERFLWAVESLNPIALAVAQLLRI